MDKLCEEKTEKKKERIFSRIKAGFGEAVRIRENDTRTLVYELLVFTVGFLLSRCHLLFGVRPLGLAFVAALPVCVWPALGGAVIGALSLGRAGMIFAAVTVIAALLRGAISYNDKDGIFREGLLLRMSVSIICGFVAAVFEVLSSGLTEASLLFGVSMIILSPMLTFIFSGLFTDKITPEMIISQSTDLFSLKDRERSEKYEILFFGASALMTLFFIGLSFRGVDILGISLAYIFSAGVTLLAAKRFGPLIALAVGFASALGISGTLSVSFALAGLAAGAIFGLGAWYAILGGGAALCAWSAYSAGLYGLLGTLPEYVIASAAVYPLLKRVAEKAKEEESEEEVEENLSEDMVGTMALAYQNGYRGNSDVIDEALFSMSAVIKSYAKAPGTLTEEEYRGIVIGVAERHCIGCSGSNLCVKEGIRPCIKNSAGIAVLLSEGKRITAENVNTGTEFCQMAGLIADDINREASKAERENYLAEGAVGSAEEYELISRLIDKVKSFDKAERTVDSEMTPALTAAMEEAGLRGTIRAFGKRRKHFILACEDENGTKITSQNLRDGIEKAAGVRLGSPEYFRKGKMALMECGISRALSVSVAVASMPGSKDEVSGDTVDFFETSNDCFYSLISDGMGSGEIARETSRFVCDFLKSALRIGEAKETLLHMLNRALKTRKEECSATVDIFEIDLLSGEATFIKSGAAPSFVKRESSIFRVRSQTAPIGLLGSIDAEKTKVDIKPGDYIIMLSDGIADETDDAPWLLLLLGEPPKRSVQEYANHILSEAVRSGSANDDMSVAVIKIEKA